MKPADLAAWVAELRAAQGLPPTVENSTSLDRIASLMRPPAEDVRVRRRAS